MKHIRKSYHTILAAAALLSIGLPTSVQASPALLNPPATLAAALKCTASPSLVGATKTPVLLVHGTAANGDYNWGANYWRALPALGYPTCTVDLPLKAMGDMQDSAEYVVYALRTMYQQSGRKVSLIGHSQGGTLVGWAMKYWEDLATQVDDAIGLAADFKGVPGGYFICYGQGGNCAPAVWQLTTGSNFMAASANKPLPAGPSFTSIYSLTDPVVTPQPTASTLDGGANMSVQLRCPGRSVSHLGMVVDNVAYAMVKDALENAGPASLNRVPATSCLQTYLPNIDLATWNYNISAGLVEVVSTAISAETVTSEPPLRSYAQ